MRYVRKRIVRKAPEPAFRRFDDGREVCFNNPAGRAEYNRRKQLVWEYQKGICDECHLRLDSLLGSRMTGGKWGDESRDDRLFDPSGKPVNRLVHLGRCLHKWHEKASIDA